MHEAGRPDAAFERSAEEFRRVAIHMADLGFGEGTGDGPAIWREAREIHEAVWFDHLRAGFDTIQRLSEAAPDDIPEIVMGSLGAAIQWGFELAVVRYNFDPRREI